MVGRPLPSFLPVNPPRQYSNVIFCPTDLLSFIPSSLQSNPCRGAVYSKASPGLNVRAMAQCTRPISPSNCVNICRGAVRLLKSRQIPAVVQCARMTRRPLLDSMYLPWCSVLNRYPVTLCEYLPRCSVLVQLRRRTCRGVVCSIVVYNSST